MTLIVHSLELRLLTRICLVYSHPTDFNYPQLFLYRHLINYLEELSNQLLQQGKTWISRNANDCNAASLSGWEARYVSEIQVQSDQATLFCTAHFIESPVRGSL